MQNIYVYGITIRVWYRKSYRTRMVRTVRVRYVPYAYGMKYAYGTQQLHGIPIASTVNVEIFAGLNVAVSAP